MIGFGIQAMLCLALQASSAVDQPAMPPSDSPVSVDTDLQVAALEARTSVQGWTVEASGLRWRRIVGNGRGHTPQVRDIITVRYTGKLIDGAEFENTFNSPVPAQLRLENVIPGWQEGLKHVAVGERIELAVPANLGFGSREIDNIPSGSTLLFDIELLGINDPLIVGVGPKPPKGVKYSRARKLRSKSISLRLTANGQSMGGWTLSTRNPDYENYAELGIPDNAEVCMISDIEKACHRLRKGEVGVFVVNYRGKQHRSLLVI